MTAKQPKSKVRSPLLDEDEVGPPRTLSERAYRIIRAAILECLQPWLATELAAGSGA